MERRRASISALAALRREELDAEAATAVWNAIEDFVRKHRQYPDAGWSISEEWLGPLAAIAEGLRPSHATTMHRWLFDDWTPDIGVSVRDDFTAYEAKVKQAREDAARQILSEQGFDELTELASSVLLPWALGSALASIDDGHDADALSLLDSDGRLIQFADGFARTRGGGALEFIRPWVERFVGRPLVQARLLQTVGVVTQAWELLPDLDPEVSSAYWAEFVPYGRGADFPHASEVAMSADLVRDRHIVVEVAPVVVEDVVQDGLARVRKGSVGFSHR